MKKIVFYYYNEKAFGSIHYELCKYLFGHGIDGVVLAWNRAYSIEEMNELDSVTDLFVTNPDGYHWMVEKYNIPSDKIVIVAHALLDLHQLIEARGIVAFDRPKAFAVVSDFLRDETKKLGIKRTPQVLRMGINVERYTVKPPAKLTTVGFAGTFHRSDPHTEYDLKRGQLVEAAAQSAGLQFKVAEYYHNSFVTMAGFYASVDCVIVASTEEGAGLPMMEAAAAGRLTIGTPVGYYVADGAASGGVVVPIEQADFLREVHEALIYYKNHPAAFQKKCAEIQRYAHQHYDWAQHIKPWVKLLSS